MELFYNGKSKCGHSLKIVCPGEDYVNIGYVMTHCIFFPSIISNDYNFQIKEQTFITKRILCWRQMKEGYSGETEESVKLFFLCTTFQITIFFANKIFSVMLYYMCT